MIGWLLCLLGRHDWRWRRGDVDLRVCATAARELVRSGSRLLYCGRCPWRAHG